MGDNPEMRRLANEMGVRQQNRPSGREKGRRRHQGRREQAAFPSGCDKLPDELAFDTFYGRDGKLRQEIFFDAGRSLASKLQHCGLKANQFRRLYLGFKAIAKALMGKRIDLPTGRERFGIFYVRHVARQVQRQVIPPIVQDLFDRHRDIILRDEREFIGFLYYLEAAYCYLESE